MNVTSSGIIYFARPLQGTKSENMEIKDFTAIFGYVNDNLRK